MPEEPDCDRYPATVVEPGMSMGLAVSWSAIGPLAVQAELAWTLASLRPVPDANDPVASEASSMRTTSGALRLSLAHSVTPYFRLGVAGGLSLIYLGRAGYPPTLSDKSVLGSSFAAAAGITLGRDASAKLGVEHRAYNVELYDSQPRAERDLLISAGVTVGLR